jgi:hypothetical protein
MKVLKLLGYCVVVVVAITVMGIGTVLTMDKLTETKSEVVHRK